MLPSVSLVVHRKRNKNRNQNRNQNLDERVHTDRQAFCRSEGEMQPVTPRESVHVETTSPHQSTQPFQSFFERKRNQHRDENVQGATKSTQHTGKRIGDFEAGTQLKPRRQFHRVQAEPQST